MSRCLSRVFVLFVAATAMAQEAPKPRQTLDADPRQKSPRSSGLPSTTSLTWSVDGRTLYSGNSEGYLCAWDPYTGKQLRAWKASDASIDELVLSPDGRTLASSATDWNNVLWEAATGRKIVKLPITGNNTFVFTPDSKEVLVHYTDGFYYWDAVTGKKGRSLGILAGGRIRLGPDGTTLAVTSEAGSGLFDRTNGKLLHRLEQLRFRRTAFSPDGRHFAAAIDDHSIRLWDITTGKELRKLTAKYVVDLTFSARGAWLAITDKEKTVRIVEVDSGKELLCLKDFKDRVESVAFSPDGRTLATGTSDCTFLWDVKTILPGQSDRIPPMLDEKALQSLWSDLSSPDAGQAYRALWKLAPASEPVVKLVAQHSQPAAVDNEKVARWMADLDSNDFAVRQRASQELAKLEDRVEVTLREAYTNSPSAEVRRRTGELVKRLYDSSSPSLLLAVRVPLLLEQIGTTEAKKELQRLAGGAESARLTRNARAALERLNR